MQVSGQAPCAYHPIPAYLDLAAYFKIDLSYLPICLFIHSFIYILQVVYR